MNVTIGDYRKVDKIIPSIESSDMWTISIIFNDNTIMVYGYLDKSMFTQDYKMLLKNMEGR
jgi:hypothetical protein